MTTHGIETVEQLRAWSRQQHVQGRRIGLVPTMGALHAGHLSLVKAAQKQCDSTLVSIFVNPTQFGPNEDFHRYPRPLANDLELLKSQGASQVFAPTVEEMYPSIPVSAGFDTSVRMGRVSLLYEGRSRPTHFDGVATIVLKLFLASGADVAFFGQKDYQQVCVIRKMVADLNVPIKIIEYPIVREPDGLAMSSRNRYLSPSQRSQATVLSQSLEEVEQMVCDQGIHDINVLRRAVEERICMASEAEIDYIAFADPVTLEELSTLPDEFVVLLAVRFGTTRLLDNCVIRNGNG